jgi:oligopeptide transport system substrate-binding protein
VSNGPYLLDVWEHGVEVVLVRNPTYWNADKVPIGKITLPIIPDEDTIPAMYDNDELHSTGQADYLAEHVRSILADPVLSQELRVLPRPGVFYIGLNTLWPPTGDVLVRRALASSIDRKSFIENVLEMPWRTPMSCTTPPRIMGHQPYGTCGYTFDPGQARAFLAEAGYPDGEGFPVLNAWSARVHEGVLEAVAAMWSENLGIAVELRTLEWERYIDYLKECSRSKEELAACEFNAYVLGWGMDYGDPQNQLEVVFAPGSAWQHTGWESERYEELIELAGSEFDGGQRAEYYQQADRILCEEEVAIIPITGFDRGILVKEGITFEFQPFGPPAFKHWDVP